MMPATLRIAFFGAILLAVPTVAVTAQEPATVAEASKVIDLETFPLMPGGVAKGPRRLANLGYAAKEESDVRGAYASKTLEERGWKELPGGCLNDQSCSGTFGKNGFTVSVSVSPRLRPRCSWTGRYPSDESWKCRREQAARAARLEVALLLPDGRGLRHREAVKETPPTLSRAALSAKGWEPYGQTWAILCISRRTRSSSRPGPRWPPPRGGVRR